MVAIASCLRNSGLATVLPFALEWLGAPCIMGRMKKGDVICPECNAGLRRIELVSRGGSAGEFRCPLCDHVLEVSDGSTEIAYRLTVAPEKLFE